MKIHKFTYKIILFRKCIIKNEGKINFKKWRPDFLGHFSKKIKNNKKKNKKIVFFLF